jgi:hypothetical protein
LPQLLIKTYVILPHFTPRVLTVGMRKKKANALKEMENRGQIVLQWKADEKKTEAKDGELRPKEEESGQGASVPGRARWTGQIN